MPVIVRSFLMWYQSASVDGRVEAVSAMAEAYLTGQLGENSTEEAEAALTLVLDDASPVVRRALAWALALSEKAPRHLLVGLAHEATTLDHFLMNGRKWPGWFWPARRNCVMRT